MEAAGELFLLITKSAEEEGQIAPLLIVHLKVLAPKPKLVTEEVGLVELVIVPDPLTKVHVPVPIVGELPDNVALLELQMN
jgi:hypothetical protein